ncbi:MAG TPA: exonuclease domain-containing protein [Gammaproteobacteria bacterium]|nr:exonuclease domain-containing protein [Gammaproteobacteria bacterium]
MQTYLFYDIETTGLSKSFDQILHFAAIRTDLALKELDRHEIKIKLNPDVVPSPYALLTHKMGIKEILNGVSEFEAIKQIHQWLNTPGTISLGYNTLGFDDEFLRFSFYRNLLKPYTHQYANHCSRMDIYPITLMFYLFKNDVLLWPETDKKISLKLEHLNAANQFISGRSHHAMVDVEITLELARRFLHEHDMWEYLHGYFKKDIDKLRLQQIQTGICVNGKLGREINFQCPVLFLGNHQHYSNQTVWLRLDTKELTEITSETIFEKSRGINKKPGEPNFILPYKERFMKHITSDRKDLIEKNQQWLKENPGILKEITHYHVNYKYPVYPETDAQARLYMNGFWSASEELFCQRFHAGNREAKIKLLQQAASPLLKTLALRILGRESVESLSLKEAEEFADYLKKIHSKNEEEILIDYQGKKRLTPHAALAEIEKIRTEMVLSEEDLGLLMEYEAYLLSIPLSP